MIKIENTEVLGWEAAIRGLRNPMNSWEKSDSWFVDDYNSEYDVCMVHSYKIPYAEMSETVEENYMNIEWTEQYTYEDLDGKKAVKEFKNSNRIFYPSFDIPCDLVVGPNDHKLMLNLAKAGSVDAKYRRMIIVTTDILAPLYWWKEFDTYKVGTVANSCSTMHKIAAKEFMLDDFSCEHLCDSTTAYLEQTIGILNFFREVYISFDEKSSDPNWFKSFVKDYDLQTKKDIWWQMIQLLPSSYNQRRTVMLNYEVLAGIYPKRKDHKLDEWHDFCDWIRYLPYSELITLDGV